MARTAMGWCVFEVIETEETVALRNAAEKALAEAEKAHNAAKDAHTAKPSKKTEAALEEALAACERHKAMLDSEMCKGVAYVPVAEGTNTASCTKWIDKHSVDGKRYRIGAFSTGIGSVKSKTETVTTREFSFA